MKYRNIVDAIQYDGDFKDSKGNYYVPKWVINKLEEEELYFLKNGILYARCTKENLEIINVGDYIVLNHDNLEIYDKDTFEKTYDRVD